MKLTRKGISTAALASLLILGGCANESPWSAGSDEAGRISLKLSADGAVKKSTRANDEVSPVIPGAHEFSITLNGTDGSYSKSWSSLESFNDESGFPMGTYTLAASYGDIETEGFSNPYFTGETNVAVRLGEETASTVTATLANAMVSIRYTDNFRAMFPQFQAMLKSEGHVSPVVLAKEESRPVYMSPRDIEFSLSLTNQQGLEQTVIPAVFTAAPRHHYVIVVDITEKVGVSTLDVAFEENVVTETTEILLTDELFTAPLPVISTNEDASAGVEAFEYIPLTDKNPELHLIAFGGIQKATLNIEASEGGVAPFSSVELTNAGPETQALISASGLECSGFYKTPDKMAVVNLKNFSTSLAPGNYKVSLNVTDALGRAIEPSEVPVVDIKVSPVQVNVEKSANLTFLSDKAEILLSSNCPNVSDGIMFSIDGSEAKVVSKTKVEGDGASLPYTYKVMLQMPNGKITEAGCEINGVFRNRTVANLEVDVDFPEISFDVDAFSNKALVSVNCEDEAVRRYLVENGKIKLGSAALEANISRDAKSSMVTLSSLTPASNYTTYNVAIGKNKEKTFGIPAFTTEAEIEIPNGNFSSLSRTINISKLNAGGQYKYGATTMQNYCELLVSEPTGWASINSKTCYTGSNPQNTWFMVPSTLASDGKVLIRSVAYDHHGTMPPLDNHGLSVRAKYSRNAPGSIGNKAAGELFLGSYSFDGTEHRVDGIAFASRPVSISFDCTYEGIENEKGWMYIAVLDESGNIISQGEKDIAASGVYTVPLQYGKKGVKAAKLQVRFISAKGDNVAAPIPTDLADVTNTTSLSGQNLGNDNKYKSLCVGSRLTLTSVKLNY